MSLATFGPVLRSSGQRSRSQCKHIVINAYAMLAYKA